MKTLFSFLIIFILTTTTLTSPASAVDQSFDNCDKTVCNTRREYVRFRERYLLGPLPGLNEDDNFEIKLKSTVDGHPCPRNAVLVKEEFTEEFLNDVEYFIFTRANGSKDDRDPGHLEVDIPFLISVYKKSGSCNETEDSYLRVSRKNEQLGFAHITGDGEAKKSPSCFRFTKFSHGYRRYAPTYMLQFCPDICNKTDPGPYSGRCYAIGNVTKGENNYLILSNYLNPLELAIRFSFYSDHHAYV